MSENPIKKQDIELALADIEFMRQVIEKRGNITPDRTEIAITSLAAMAALVLLICEQIVFPGVISDDLLAMGKNTELRNVLLLEAGGTLIVLLAGSYGLAWARAKELQSSLNRILNRTFDFLKFESFVPDLALKAFILIAIILSRQTLFLSAVFIAFIGDYVLQDRFFRLINRPIKVLAGIAIYVCAASALLNSWTSISIPLGIFVCVSLVSVSSILFARMNKNG